MAVAEHIVAAIEKAQTFDDLAATFASTFYFSVDNWKERIDQAVRAKLLLQLAQQATDPIDRAERGYTLDQAGRGVRSSMMLIGVDPDDFLADIDAIKTDRPVGQIAMETYLAAGAMPESVTQEGPLAEVKARIKELTDQTTEILKESIAITNAEVARFEEQEGLADALTALKKLRADHTAAAEAVKDRYRAGEITFQEHGEQQDRLWQELASAEEPFGEKLGRIHDQVRAIRKAANARHYESTKGIEAELGELHAERLNIEGGIHRRVLDHVLETSEITQDAADEWAGTQTITDAAKRRLKKIGYPEDQIRKDMAEFYRLTGGRLGHVTIETKGHRRANALVREGKVRLDDRFDQRTLWHELGHLLEQHPRIAGMANAFLDARTGRQRGERPKSLRRIKKNRFFKSGEVAYEDQFFDAYVGKIYPDGFTEVLSMGMQQFSSPGMCMELKNRDPEMFHLMVGMMKTPMGEIERELVGKYRAAAEERKSTEENAKAFYRELEKKSRDIEARIKGTDYLIETYGRNQHVAMVRTEPGKHRLLSSFKSKKKAGMFMYLYIWAEQVAGREMARQVSHEIGYQVEKGQIPHRFFRDAENWEIPDIEPGGLPKAA